MIPYGPRAQRGDVEKKTRQVAAAPMSAGADMAGYLSRNAAKTSGEAITGAGDLVADVKAGRQKLGSVKDEDLPDNLRKMKPRNASDSSTSKMAERKALNERMAALVKQRDAYVLEQAKKSPVKPADSVRPRCGGNPAHEVQRNP